MPETPDFDQIARDVLPFCLGVKDSNDVPEACGLIAEQLRLVWNARGAADITKLEQELSTLMGSMMAGPYVKNLARALRTLDR
jgi:hypothetical protein